MHKLIMENMKASSVVYEQTMVLAYVMPSKLNVKNKKL